MADGPLHLGLDVGTQGTKGLLLDAGSGEIVARASEPYGLIEDLPAGAAEQHPETWMGAVRKVVQALLAAPGVVAGDVAGIGVSGQQHGFVALDEEDRAIRPAKLWCDTSTEAEAAELSETFGAPVPTGYTASKILWMKRREPDGFERLRSVLLPHDYIDFRLTGDKTMEAGDASGTGLFDPVARRFDPERLRAIDERLAGMLPPLLEPGEPAGALSAEAAAALGLPEGIPVAAGGGDNMMSAIGSGATRAGVVVVSLGTSGTVFTRTDAPVVDPSGAIAPFCDSTGGWLPLLCVMNATGVTEELRAAFGADDEAGLERLTAEAAEVPAGCGGMLLLPFLQGERVPDLPGASGTLTGLRAGSLRRGPLFRAAIEGVTLNLGWGVDRMRDLGIAVDAVRLVGGGSRNALWRQVVADVLDAPVRVLAEPESAALGAALQSLWTRRRRDGEEVSADEVAAPHVRLGDETIEPDPSSRDLYRELGARFRELVERIHGPIGEDED